MKTGDGEATHRWVTITWWRLEGIRGGSIIRVWKLVPSRKRWDPEGSENLEPQKRQSLYWKHLRQGEIPGFPLLLANQSSAMAPIGQTKIHRTVKPDSKDSDMELSTGRRGKGVRTGRKWPVSPFSVNGTISTVFLKLHYRSKLPNKEFKVTIIKMLNVLGKRMDKHSENLNNGFENRAEEYNSRNLKKKTKQYTKMHQQEINISCYQFFFLPHPGIKPGSPHCRQILYQLSCQGSHVFFCLNRIYSL